MLANWARYEFESFFSDIGPVRSSFVVREKAEKGENPPSKPRCRGFGFVQLCVVRRW